MAYWKNYLDYEKIREETYGNIYKKLGMDYNEVNEISKNIVNSYEKKTSNPKNKIYNTTTSNIGAKSPAIEEETNNTTNSANKNKLLESSKVYSVFNADNNKNGVNNLSKEERYKIYKKNKDAEMYAKAEKFANRFKPKTEEGVQKVVEAWRKYEDFKEKYDNAKEFMDKYVNPIISPLHSPFAKGIRTGSLKASNKILNFGDKLFNNKDTESGMTPSEARIYEYDKNLYDGLNDVEKIGAKTGNFVGENLTDMAYYSALLGKLGITSNVASPVGKAVTSGATKLGVGTTASNLAGSFVKNGMEDAILTGVLNSPDVLRGNTSVDDYVKKVATEGAIGGVFGGAVETGLPALFRRGTNSIRNAYLNTATSTIDDTVPRNNIAGDDIPRNNVTGNDIPRNNLGKASSFPNEDYYNSLLEQKNKLISDINALAKEQGVSGREILNKYPDIDQMAQNIQKNINKYEFELKEYQNGYVIGNRMTNNLLPEGTNTFTEDIKLNPKAGDVINVGGTTSNRYGFGRNAGEQYRIKNFQNSLPTGEELKNALNRKYLLNNDKYNIGDIYRKNQVIANNVPDNSLVNTVDNVKQETPVTTSANEPITTKTMTIELDEPLANKLGKTIDTPRGKARVHSFGSQKVTVDINGELQYIDRKLFKEPTIKGNSTTAPSKITNELQINSVETTPKAKRGRPKKVINEAETVNTETPKIISKNPLLNGESAIKTTAKSDISFINSKNKKLLNQYAKGDIEKGELIKRLEDNLNKKRFQNAIKQQELVDNYRSGKITEAQKNKGLEKLNKEFAKLESELNNDKKILNAISKKKENLANINNEMAMTSIEEDDLLSDWGLDDTVSTTKPYVTATSSNEDDLLGDWGLDDVNTTPVSPKANTIPDRNVETLNTGHYIDENGIKRLNEDRIGFAKYEKPSFKETLKNFYTRFVDVNNPLKKSSEKTFIKATNSSKTNSLVGNIFTNNLTDMEGKTIGKSLGKLFDGIDNMDDYREYIYLKHNIDRVKYQKPIFPDFTIEDSMKTVKHLEELHPEFKAKSQELVKWIDDFVYHWGVEGGLIDEDTYKVMREMYPNYVPTNRIFEEFESGKTFNEIAGKYVDLGVPFKKATGSNRVVDDLAENMLNLVNKTVKTAKFNEVGISFLNDIRAGKLGNIATELTGDVPAGQKNIVTVIENGKKVSIKIDDKQLLKALERMNKNVDGDVGKVLRKGTNLFKSLITDYNPLFSVFNGFRDFQNYLINTVEDNPFKALWRLADSYAEVSGLKKNASDYELYRNLGGGGSNIVSGKSINTMAKEIHSGKKSRNPLRLIQNMNNAIENAPRLAEFKNSIAKDLNLDQAIYNSSDVTTNFARNGDITRTIDSGVPFLNASVQGVDKIARQFKKRPVATTLKGLGYITAPTFLLNQTHEGDEDYEGLANRNKDNYYNFNNPFGDGYIRLPKSRDYGTVFGAIPERIQRYAKGDNNAFKGLGNTISDSLLPVNMFDSNIASTGINLARNKDFAGRTIVPQSLQSLEPQMQYDYNTSLIGKGIGGLLNVSPKKVDYVIDNTTGIIGDILLPATTNVDNVADGFTNAFNRVVKNKFISDPLYSNQDIEDFYDYKNEIATKHTTNKRFDRTWNDYETTEDLNRRYNDVAEEISSITKEINALAEEGNTKSNEIMIKNLRAKRIQLARELNNYYYNLK